MQEELEILKIQHNNGSIVEGRISWDRQKYEPWRYSLEFTSSPIKYLKFTNVDLFECLVDLRQELIKYGYRTLCNGARLDVYPSGMCRDMGGGSVAYILKTGTRAKSEDTVHIFDYAEPELITSVEDQLNFFKSWLKSLNKPQILNIQHSNGSVVKGEVTQSIDFDSRICKIYFASSVISDLEYFNKDYFQCLIDFRRELARFNYVPLCNGSRLETYVFHKDIAMLSGDKVFTLVEGKIPEEDDRLFTFDYAAPNLIASVEQQRDYYESWLNSIKSIPISEYGNFGVNYFPELYFRLIRLGDLPLMWLFDIDYSNFPNLDSEINQLFEDNNEHENLRALSPLSPEQVEKIGSLKGEAILGFITGDILSIEYFRPNRVFIDFMQNVIGIEAPKDPDIQAAASEQQEGWIYIVDRRVSGNPQKETSQEDILGAFELKNGQIVPNSYQPNKNYLIFGENGLFQLPDLLHQALISALEAL